MDNTKKKKVGIVSPSKAVKKENIQKGLEYLSQCGFEPVLGENVFKSFRYTAGTPQERAQDLMHFYQDPEICAIFATAGGDGSQMIAPFLDYECIKKNPKPLIGFSDTTAIQNAVLAQTGIKQLSGFLLTYDFLDGQIDPLIDTSLQNLLKAKKWKAQGGTPVVRGKCQGRLIGGCISLFKSLCGTPYMPSLKDAVLLIEDEEEKTYKIELMLEQLRQQPDFAHVKGIVFGKFKNCEIRRPEDGSVDEVINYFAQSLKIPVLSNFPYGHQKSRYVVPLGSDVILDSGLGTLEEA